MDRKGLYNAVGFVIIFMALIVMYLQFSKLQKAGEERLSSIMKSTLSQNQMADFSVQRCSDSNSQVKDSNLLSLGIRVKNLGPGTAHYVTVYHLDRDAGVQKLQNSSKEQYFEMGADTSACFTGTGTVKKRDSIVVQSLEAQARLDVD